MLLHGCATVSQNLFDARVSHAYEHRSSNASKSKKVPGCWAFFGFRFKPIVVWLSFWPPHASRPRWRVGACPWAARASHSRMNKQVQMIIKKSCFVWCEVLDDLNMSRMVTNWSPFLSLVQGQKRSTSPTEPTKSTKWPVELPCFGGQRQGTGTF